MRKVKSKPKYDYEISFSDEGIKHLLGRGDRSINQVLTHFYLRVEGSDGSYFDKDNNHTLRFYEKDMEKFIKEISSVFVSNSNPDKLHRLYNNIFFGEKYIIKYIDIEKYRAENYSLVKDFPDQFDFVFDKYDNLVPVSRWEHYDYGIENDGNIYMVKNKDAIDIIKKVCPFFKIKKFNNFFYSQNYSHDPYGMDGF